MKRAVAMCLAVATALGPSILGGCSSSHAPSSPGSDHSSSILVSADDRTVYVANADADSVSFLDVHAGKLAHEVLLGGAHPQVNDSGRFEPAIGPRALALAPGGGTLYVTGEWSGHVYAVDTATAAVVRDASVCAEPAGVVASPDGQSVYVACSQEDRVVELDAGSLAIKSSAPCDRRPWGLAWSSDRSRLYVTHLLGPGVTVFAPSPLSIVNTWATADGPPQSDPTDNTGAEDPMLPHGPARGLYDVAARPGSSEVWVAHMMLGIDTPQPQLVFNNTAFPALSLFDAKATAAGGNQLARLSVSAVPGDDGAFGDVVAAPHAIAFSPDGKLAFVADTGSDDVLVVDATTRYEATLVRPLPGHQPEGVAVSGDGHVYVDQRNTSDVAVLSYTSGDAGPVVTVGAILPRLTSDPMPPQVRLGQHVFYTANSDEMPITQDHWVACATCHVEGRSDAVTWLFEQGPRDTPSNAGGTVHTGFLFRTAARTKVQDYWRTINIEQGGHFDPSIPALSADLDAVAAFANLAIPYPRPSTLLAPLDLAAGKALFNSLGCSGCHAGAFFTDSGSGNDTLDLSGPVKLHDVGTCVTSGGWIDNAVPDVDGNPRSACAFDTPSLRGVADSAPYLHDGSAATIEDVFRLAPDMVGAAATQLSDDDKAKLVAYLKSL
ncbi:MAG TPA: beta-propeller fold lactonase family protein [Polyangiaceae bacterium]|jgi:YVTN family beta-propeller protein